MSSLQSQMSRPRLHYGSLEEVERKRQAAAAGGAGASSSSSSSNDASSSGYRGAVTFDDLSADAPDIGDSGRRAKAEHQAILEDFERKKLARSIAVPTDDRRVRRRLQSYGQPQTLFGEGPGERRDRLRQIMTERMEVDGVAGEDYNAEIDESEDEDYSDDSDGSGVEDDDDENEEIYSYGCEELLEARHRVAAWSVRRAARRLAAQRAELEIPLTQRKKMKHEWYSHLKTFSFNASQIGDDRPLGYCAFAPNSKVIATGSWSGLTKLWSVPDCNHLLTLKGHKDRVSGIAFHPGATISQQPGAINLATCGMDGTVNLHNFESSTPIANLVGHEMRVSRVAFHPSGRYIGTASYDQTWRLWDVETQKELLLQDRHSREVFCIGFQCDGSLAVSAGMDAIGRVWDLRTGRSIFVLQGHVRPIVSLDWSPNGYTLATGSEDNQVRIWDARQAKSSHLIPAHTSLVSQVRFWHAGDGFESKGAAESMANARRRKEGMVNGVADMVDNSQEWTITSPAPFGRRKKHGGHVEDGGSGSGAGSNGNDANGSTEMDLDEDEDDLDFDPSRGYRDDDDDDDEVGGANSSLRRQLLTGGHLVTSSYDGTCKIFTEGDWKPIKSLAGLEGKVMSCDVSGDGKFIATASYDRTFKLFSPE